MDHEAKQQEQEQEQPTEEELDQVNKWINEWCRYKQQETEILKNEIKPLRNILKENVTNLKEYIKKYPHMSPIKLGDSHMLEDTVQTQCTFSKSIVSSYFNPEDVDAYIRDNTVKKQQLRLKKRKRTSNQTNCTTPDSLIVSA
jgi:hypothetical protein